jgi:hypothetical protein
MPPADHQARPLHTPSSRGRWHNCVYQSGEGCSCGISTDVAGRNRTDGAVSAAAGAIRGRYGQVGGAVCGNGCRVFRKSEHRGGRACRANSNCWPTRRRPATHRRANSTNGSVSWGTTSRRWSRTSTPSLTRSTNTCARTTVIGPHDRRTIGLHHVLVHRTTSSGSCSLTIQASRPGTRTLNLGTWNHEPFLIWRSL